ncbi:MAG: hypothetical protein KJ887_06580 [Candidatus Omnitrophica bacterium]|nr:hypothetical protein [Candidatus Omnitrophota bacterium]MBU1048310.1 hypothetical protein [Candidatus Omnitrophota bacterium]MBU1630277.1 hypothetical protein [Candidatus Omnitrophota bacterium]MBU1766534.1 hypothetical protein [Candidatus Omnitrophota bacterium]MBU1889708.1 hypothetical protein [Candidatus Omnitrophota bacterium]
MDNNSINSRWSKLAIIGFIVSISGLILGMGLSSFGTIPLLSILLGIISIIKINKNSDNLRGKGFAIAGIILGGLGLILPLWILTSVIWTMIARA